MKPIEQEQREITMKAYLQTLKETAGWSLALASALTAGQLQAAGAENQGLTSRLVATKTLAGGERQSTGSQSVVVGTATGGGGGSRAVTIQAIEPVRDGERAHRKDLPWLGLSTDEAPEVLVAQLGLNPGVGLAVTYVAPDSPAAKAGLQKNDVLVQFEDQSLVHPAQLRKLVQVRKEGDTVKLVFYRAGKQQTVSVTLGKTSARSGFGWGGGGHDNLVGYDLGELENYFNDLRSSDATEPGIKAFRESLETRKVDQKNVLEEVRRSLETARKAYGGALRQATNASSGYSPAFKAFQQLAQAGALVDNDASVTVRSTGKSAKSVVKADDSGTIVIVGNPKLRLTAHDKDGHLLFDGEIETAEQRAKVPRDLWERVEPLLDKMGASAAESPEAD
jgi:hypothetical protein